MPPNLPYAGIALSVALLLLGLAIVPRKKTLRFPPGPRSYPLVGNILSFNPRSAWLKLITHKSTYGDIVFFHGLGNYILVLNTAQVIEDLLDKRATIYSDRPVFTVVGELMALGQSMPLLPYGKEWRECRKLAHAGLNAPSVRKYHQMQEDLSALLNKEILDDPAEFFSHVRLTAGRIILALTYGLSVRNADDKYITHAEDTMELISKALVPGAYLCDLFPIMKYLPGWFPFQREAAKGKEMIERLVSMPLEHVKREMSEGAATPSLTKDLLELGRENEPGFDHRVKWTTGSLYGAGGETTYATVLTFIMLMALNQDKQRLAQAEIDRVVGSTRAPVMSDRNNLPYVCAVIKETMRYHPALPLSIARLTPMDDTYNGFFIPKGTIVLPNVWAIAYEPNSKYDPSKFIPERFLDEEIITPDPASYAFGFGRRICPGKAVGENSVFILIAGILSSFDIFPPDDGSLNVTFGPNLVSFPEKFNCRIQPRSLQVVERIDQRASQVRS